jgi:16S rRNA processing protein RimM
VSSRSSSDSPLVCVGKIKAPRGLQGELHAIFFSPPRDWINKVDSFWVGPDEDDVQKISILKCSEYSGGYHLRLAGIADRSAAEEAVGLKLYLPEELFVSEAGEVIFLREILGFVLMDREEPVGEIVGFSSNGPQDLLVVSHKNRKVEIPFVDAFIIDINFQEKKVLMELPVGLWQEE